MPKRAPGPDANVALLDLFFSARGVGLAFLDRDLRYVRINDSLADVNGLPAAAHIGHTVRELLPEIAPIVEPMLRKVIESGEPVLDFEVTGKVASSPQEIQTWLSSYYPLRDPSGKVSGVGAVLVNITERKRAELELRRGIERIDLLSRATNDGIWEWDVVADRHWWSDRFYDVFGFDRGKVSPGIEAWVSRIHAEDRDRVASGFRAALEGPGTTWGDEFRYRFRDDIWGHVLDRAYLIRNADGHPIRVIGAMMDVTRQRRLEEQLHHAQKLESVGRLAGGVAHDFNNLLTAVLGYVAIARDAVAHDRMPRLELDEIEKAGDRAASLTRQLLAFARRQIVAPRTLDLNDLTRNMNRTLHRLLGEGIELTIRYSSAPATIRADRSQLEQVLNNLALNARDAMTAGGVLTIEIDHVVLNESQAADLGIPHGRYVMIAVSDTGTGMSQETRDHIFEPFFTTKGAAKGVGLGLATSYGIVQQHDGHIRVNTEPGRGTTFKIYLPPVDEAPHPVALEESAEAPRGTETILLVEDEAILLTLATRVLEDQGYTVLVGANGPDALQVAERHGGVIHLLVTDVVMPQMSGRVLADLLRPRCPGVRVLFTSGYTEDAILRHGVIEADIHFLQKPFLPSALVRKIREVLDAPPK
jgi:signal transduction histidine kinase